MEPKLGHRYIAFADFKKIADGEIQAVATKVKKFLKSESKTQILIFDEVTSAQIEIDFRGSGELVQKKLEARLAPPDAEKKAGPGRPKLGVIAKEITLLPDHWEWLTRQPGGASVTLRRLVDEAKKKNINKDLTRQAQEAAYKFMTVMGGDLPHYEEALRALYASDVKKFESSIAAWPKDVQDHASKLAQLAWAKP